MCLFKEQQHSGMRGTQRKGTATGSSKRPMQEHAGPIRCRAEPHEDLTLDEFDGSRKGFVEGATACRNARDGGSGRD